MGHHYYYSKGRPCLNQVPVSIFDSSNINTMLIVFFLWFSVVLKDLSVIYSDFIHWTANNVKSQINARSKSHPFKHRFSCALLWKHILLMFVRVLYWTNLSSRGLNFTMTYIFAFYWGLKLTILAIFADESVQKNEVHQGQNFTILSHITNITTLKPEWYFRIPCLNYVCSVVEKWSLPSVYQSIYR